MMVVVVVTNNWGVSVRGCTRWDLDRPTGNRSMLLAHLKKG